MELVNKFIGIIKNASPDLKRRLFMILILLVLFNGLVWLYAFLAWQKYPTFFGLITLAYGLGLRHAVDADHIAVIDNTVRKLMSEGKRPVGVGFFFSLGHSTIVIILSCLAAFSAGFVKNNLPYLKETGALIGTSISSFFLLAIGIVNLIVFLDIFKVWRKIKMGGKYQNIPIEEHLNKRGIMTSLLKPFLKSISKSLNMYAVGFLFGLGFDTASEIGLLSISAATGVSGMPILNIIILPLAFTAGMSLVDTLDGILMLGAYGWAYINPTRKLYYNMNITFFSAVTALLLGGIEVLQVIKNL